jgi:hypothetical protein
MNLGGLPTIPFSAENAEQITEFVYNIFGYTYPDKRLYTPARLLQELTGFVCLGPTGKVYGLVIFYFDFPSRSLVEIGGLMVDPLLGESTAGQVLKALMQALAPGIKTLMDEHGLLAALNMNVVEHQLAQRLSDRMGFVTAGFLLGYISKHHYRFRTKPHDRIGSRATVAEASTGRKSLALSVRPIRSKTPPHTVSLPERYEAITREIYDDFRIAVTYQAAVAPEGPGRIEAKLDFTYGIASLLVIEVGTETIDELAKYVEHYRSGFVEVIHIVLPLSGTNINPVVEFFVARGFTFGAVLPQYVDGPALIMQSVDRALLAPIAPAALDSRAARILALAL